MVKRADADSDCLVNDLELPLKHVAIAFTLKFFWLFWRDHFRS